MNTAGLLAINGGPRVRSAQMPRRRAFGEAEAAKVMEVIQYFRDHDVELGYEGGFEEQYCGKFSEYMGGGYCDAVATGTASVYIALAAFHLPKGSEVVVSPITDAGPINSIILQGYIPVLADSMPGSYNMGVDQFLARVTPKTRAVIVAHMTGQPVAIDTIVAEANARGIKVIEDCAQAHGAKWNGQQVGTFGEIAAFSTMFKKIHMTGGSGGVVFTRDHDLHRVALAHADRGKPRWRSDFDDRSPMTNMFPALNWNTDEISCAIGTASLARLDETIANRLAFVRDVTRLIEQSSRVCRPIGFTEGDSPFIYPIVVDETRIVCDKRTFAEAVRAEGIDLNPHYGFVVYDWPWVRPYLSDGFSTPNSRDIRDRSFCLYLNERYGHQEAEDVAAAIVKVEAHFAR